MDFDREPTTEEEKEEVRQVIIKQQRDLPLTTTCPCGSLVSPTSGYRCFFCGIYFCRKCAERHFKKGNAS